MRVAETKAELREAVAVARMQGLRIGLVPTMGYFHEGHLSLMRICRSAADFVVVSLFVNPTQFAPGEDLARYPRDLERDFGLAGREGVDLMFAPAAAEMYAADASTVVEETQVSRGLCGVYRPGHFKGVATVVTKLFNIVIPDIAVFGRKDLQQLTVIRRLARDLDLPVGILAGPIVREPDGLALSSRNVYLTPDQRRKAPGLYRALQKGSAALAGATGETGALLEGLRREIEAETGGRVEYLSAVDELMAEAPKAEDCRYLAAAIYLGATRLIDNVEVRPAG